MKYNCKKLIYIIILSIISIFGNIITAPKYGYAFDISHYNYYDNDDFYVRSFQNSGQGVNRFNFSISKQVEWLDNNIPFCAEIYDNLLDCIPNICQTNQDGILYVRQTMGYEGDYCVFHERFVYQGILTCKFKPEENEDALLLLNRFQNGIELQIDDNEFEQMKDFYRKNCDTKLEDKYINALMIASDSYDLELLNTNTIFAYEPTIPVDRILIPKKQLEEGEVFDQSFWFSHSVSFFDQTYSVLLPIANAIKDRNAEALSGINRNKLGGVSQNLEITSLLYVNPLKWSVWINGEKFDSESNNKNIRIASIDSKHVNLVWEVVQIDNVSFNWRKNYRFIGDNIFVSKDGRNSVKKIDDNSYLVEFQLGLGEVFNVDTLLTINESLK